MVLGQFYNIAADHYHDVNADRLTAMQFCQSGLALALVIGDKERQSLALCVLAYLKTKAGYFSEAQEIASESQRAARLAGNLYVESNALRIEAVCWQHLGSYSHCMSLLDRATHLLDLCGMAGGQIHSAIRIAQAEVHRCKSEYLEARKIQMHILQDISEDQNPYQHGLGLLNIAQIDVETGATDNDVQWTINTAAILFQKINFSVGITYCDMFRAALDLQLSKFPAARDLFQKCLQSAWGTDTETITYCLEKLGAVQQWESVDQVSFPQTVTLLVHSVKSKQRLELHKALQFIGDIFQALGDEETAISLFTVALEGFTQMDVHRSRAECLIRLGDICKKIGDEVKAMGLWETARPLFERSSQGKQLANLDAKLARLSHKPLKEVQQ
jgi:tetratricopeptide (TPR) repeat protein